MDNWRTKVVATLAADPEQWRSLGELFRIVADEIPMHHALRRAAGLERLRRVRSGDDTAVEADDLDLVKAQWLHFTAFVLPMVDRQAKSKRSSRSDMVRLTSHGPCEACAGPTYLAGPVGRGRHAQHACPRCAAAKVITVIENPAPPPAPKPKPAPPPSLRLVVVPKLKPAEPLPPPPPPRREKRSFFGLAFLSSIAGIWDEFAFQATEAPELPFPRFEQNRKLRVMLHRALEAGAAQEFKQMTMFRGTELQQIGFPELRSMDSVMYFRAADWVRTKTPTLTKVEREAWGIVLCEAYRVGSIAIISMTMADRLRAISDEMEELIAKLEPAPQRARAPPRVRWRNAFRKATRWRFS